MASNTTAPAETCTVPDFIAAGVNDDMTYRNFSILEVQNGIEFIDHCIIDDYLDELKLICVEITGLTDRDRAHYRYSPDLLAYDMYGSTQLDFIVMIANGVVTPTEFTMKGNLYLPKNSVLKEFMSMVYNAESEAITTNRTDIGEY
jgi:hypothetical protein